MTQKKQLSTEERSNLLIALKQRFEKNVNRHKGLVWENVQRKLESTPEKLWSLHAMESTGGEPDVVAFDNQKSEYIF